MVKLCTPPVQVATGYHNARPCAPAPMAIYTLLVCLLPTPLLAAPQANEDRARLQRTEGALQQALGAHEVARNELAALQQKYAIQAKSLEDVRRGAQGQTAGHRVEWQAQKLRVVAIHAHSGNPFA